jgi:uncharacterized protein YukE
LRLERLKRKWSNMPNVWTGDTEAVYNRVTNQLLQYVSDPEGVTLFFEKVKKSLKMHNARGTCLTENAHKDFFHCFRGALI